MGLTIHYSGSFRDLALLPEMIAEVKDISEEFKWTYHIFETEFPKDGFGQAGYNDRIYGISTGPPKCEPLWFCFLSNGKMSSPPHLQFWGKDADTPDAKFLHQLFTKTQFAGIEAHKVVIHLFRHISEKYLRDFTMMDEGEYWETKDEKVLEENFKRYDYLIDSFSFALENFPKGEGENLEEYLRKVFEKIHKTMKNKENE